MSAVGLAMTAVIPPRETTCNAWMRHPGGRRSIVAALRAAWRWRVGMGREARITWEGSELKAGRAGVRWLLAIAMAMTAGPGAAVAAERNCVGELGRVRVAHLRVPEGATCKLTGTWMKGNLRVGRGATLHASGIWVDGSVYARDARLVRIGDTSRIGGNLQVRQGEVTRVVDSVIRGNLLLEGNRRETHALGNVVRGSLQLFGNSGAVAVSANEVGGNLECRENRPAPSGRDNQVSGRKEDQCAKL